MMGGGGKWRRWRWPLLTLGVDPVRIQIGQSSLVAGVLNGFGGLLVDDTTRPSPPSSLALGHIGVRGQPARRSVDVRGEGDGTGND